VTDGTTLGPDGPDGPDPRADAAAPLPCAGSDHLTLLLDEFTTLALDVREAVTRVEHTDPAGLAALRAEQRARTIGATLQLDGALTDSSSGEREGTWFDALASTVRRATGTTEDTPTVDDPEVARLIALERRGVEAALDADGLAAGLAADVRDAAGLGGTLLALHARLTAGLIVGDRVGSLRRGPRVVHDASVGRVLHFPTDPALLPDAWDALLRDAARAAARPVPVRAGLLHLELLRHHPFDAANGRLARVAHDHALRAAGLLPHGLASVDSVLVEDPLGYLDGVAASVRRRDATAWIERLVESMGVALHRTRDALAALDGGASDDDAPTEQAPALPTTLEEHFTLADVVEALGIGAGEARRVTSRWVVTGRVERVIGSSGLRLRRR
jgi:hypothetical protein